MICVILANIRKGLKIPYNLQIVKSLANDERFELHYYGTVSNVGPSIECYCNEHNINNVFFHGEYKPEDRYEFVKRTDIIHNSYYDANTMLAMGNKYYDGIIFRIPQLCMSGSYMSKRCLEKGVGIDISPYDTEFADKLCEYYKSLNWEDFYKSCDEDLAVILREYEYGARKLKGIFNK